MNQIDKAKAKARHQRKHTKVMKYIAGKQTGVIVNGGGINYAEWLLDAMTTPNKIVKLFKGYATIHDKVAA